MLKSTNRSISPLLLIILLAVVLRIILPLLALAATRQPAIFSTADTPSYLLPAQSLFKHGSFANGQLPEIIRTPGYPVFLIPGIFLKHPIAVTLILQIVLSCLTVGLVYLIAMNIYSSKPAALMAGLLYAVEPLSLLYSAKLMTETLFVFLLVSHLYILILYLKGPKLRFLLAAAFTGAALSYVRPIGYYLPIIIVLFLGIYLHKKQRFWMVFFPQLILFLLLTFVLLLPWQVRNSRQAGYSEFSAISVCNLYFHAMPALLAHQQGYEYTHIKAQMCVQNYEGFYKAQSKLSAASQGAALKLMKRQALFVIRGNIPFFTLLHINGMIRTLAGPGATEYLKYFNKQENLPGKMDDHLGMLATLPRIIETLKLNAAFAALNILLGLILSGYYFLSVYPLIGRKINIDGSVLFLFLVGFYFITLSGGFVGQSRLRHPVMPIICIFAGYGLYLFYLRKARLGKPASN